MRITATVEAENSIAMQRVKCADNDILMILEVRCDRKKWGKRKNEKGRILNCISRMRLARKRKREENTEKHVSFSCNVQFCWNE